MDAENNREFDEMIGFDASANITEKEFDALRGISFLRNIRQDEEAISRKKALKALAESPQLEKRFRKTFPFIEW